MDIFESLENLPVSEACFEDIIGIVEEYIQEKSDWTVKKWRKAAISSLANRAQAYQRAEDDFEREANKLSDDELQKREEDAGAKYHRMKHAEGVAFHMPDSNMEASKVIKAANKVDNDRSNKQKTIVSIPDSSNADKMKVTTRKAHSGSLKVSGFPSKDNK